MSEKKKEEAGMMNDRNYEVLAQIYTILNDKMSKKSIAMRKVLQKDFDINYSVPKTKCSLPNIVGRTALDFALEKRELEIFKMLIRHGADFADKNQSGSTILHRMIEKSYVKSKECYRLKGKLEHPFVDAVLSAHIELKKVANPINQDGISHFHIACIFNHVEAIKFFLDQGVFVNEAIDQDSTIFPGSTPLHLATRYSAYGAAKFLLDHNANVNVRDARGLYPLFLLIQRNSEILDMKNVQKKELCKKLKDELSINENIIKLLLEKSKNNEAGLSRCHVACTLQDTRFLEDILVEGVNLKDSVSGNSPLWPGHTALHFAALFNINAVRLLVANSADIMTKAANGVTPFDLCLQRYSPRAIHSLITAVPAFNEITFLNTKTKVADLILAMSETSTLRSFLQGPAENANMSVPFDSPLWPGYTILHIAIILSYRIHDNKDLYEGTDYENVQGTRRSEIEQECYQKIELCLAAGADVTATDSCKSTPLHLAFRLQNSHIVKLLFEYHHKIVNIADSVNLSHLHIACAAGQSDLVEKLLQTGINVNQPIKSHLIYRLSDHEEDTPKILYISPGWTCLHIAMATSNEKLAELLMRHGAGLYAKDSFEMMPLHQALQSGCRFSLQKLYEDQVTSFGLSHLHVACFFGDIKAVEELLRNGANMEGTINLSLVHSTEVLSALAPFDGYTPVHFALRERHFEIIKLLVQRGVNLLAKSANGTIPLYESLRAPYKGNKFYDSSDEDSDEKACDDDFNEEDYYHREYYGYYYAREHFTFGRKLLSDERIEEIVKEDSGITKLHIACLEVRRNTVNKLLKNGADPNAQVNEDFPIWPGCTPLHVLLTPRSTDDGFDDPTRLYDGIKRIAKILFKRGASVMLKDAAGSTPVHRAPELMWSDSKLTDARDDGCCDIGWILEGHKDFNANPVDACGVSHFDVACMCAQDKIIEKFLQHGVDVDRQFGHFSDRYGGFTALHLAVLYKDEAIFQSLAYDTDSPNVKDFLGNTPMHTAAVYCRLGNNGFRPSNDVIYMILFDVGADAETKNLWDETPLQVILRTNKCTSNFIFLLLHDYPRACCINLFNIENEEGCLGIELRWNGRLPIEKNLCYETIMKYPNLNDADEMGRTVIHNVVSVKKPPNPFKTGSIEAYTKYIYGFIQLDYDIDCQDNKGHTPLHKAVIFGNYNAVVGLLMNGADINILDASNKPAFFYSIDHGEQDKEILKAFLLHVHKLQMVGLEVSSANRKLVERIRGESISCGSEIQRCSKELENLKNHLISKYYSVTLYNFLTEAMFYYRTMLLFCDDVDEIFVKNVGSLRDTYPQFAGLLQMQYRNSFIRAPLVDPAKSALNVLLSKLPLPDLCFERIIKSLRNKDLKQLIVAAQ